MSAYDQGSHSWMHVGFYPVQERLIHGANADVHEVHLVDIGGNKGHEILKFNSRWANAPGRLILQDLPVVIGDIQQTY
jgi:hypothetical protein